MDEPLIRLFGPDDSIAELTRLLHRAYAAQAARGLRFLASHQDQETTRKRISRGECYVALLGQEMIGTSAWRNASQTRGCPWYDRPDVASFGQLAVDPQYQRQGIGSKLLSIAEERSAATGAAELALDTAEPAHDLIDFYTKRGYRFIEYVKWDVVNYRSVVLSKRVHSSKQN